MVENACYDRGSTFRLKCFLNDGAPSPKIVENKIFFLHDSRRVPSPWDIFIQQEFYFCSITFLGEVYSSQVEQPQQKKWCTSIVARFTGSSCFLFPEAPNLMKPMLP